MFMSRSANNGMRRFGPSPLRRGAAATRDGANTPSRSGWLHFAGDWKSGVNCVSVARGHSGSKDVPSTVVLMHAKSGSALLNARISDGHTKVKSLG